VLQFVCGPDGEFIHLTVRICCDVIGNVQCVCNIQTSTHIFHRHRQQHRLLPDSSTSRPLPQCCRCQHDGRCACLDTAYEIWQLAARRHRLGLEAAYPSTFRRRETYQPTRRDKLANSPYQTAPMKLPKTPPPRPRKSTLCQKPSRQRHRERTA
jgi:hypothetical protein